jgi:putative transposase
VIARSLEVSRSNLYQSLKEKIPMKPFENESNERLLEVIREIIDIRPTYGYRRVTAMARKELGQEINFKRVYRLMKENGLLLQRYTGRPTYSHEGKVQTLKSDVRWCTDAFGIQCWNGEQLQVAFSMDCHDREVVSWVSSSKGIDGGLVRDLMAETVEQRFGKTRVPHKVQWLSDNGPGYVARQTVEFGRSLGLEICTTRPYSPESNGMAEAFVKRFKMDYAYVNDLSSAERVRKQLPKWFNDYNENAPHKALKLKSPREYRKEKTS